MEEFSVSSFPPVLRRCFCPFPRPWLLHSILLLTSLIVDVTDVISSDYHKSKNLISWGRGDVSFEQVSKAVTLDENFMGTHCELSTKYAEIEDASPALMSWA